MITVMYFYRAKFVAISYHRIRGSDSEFGVFVRQELDTRIHVLQLNELASFGSSLANNHE